MSTQKATDQIEALADDAPNWEQRWDERDAIEDVRLRLVFTCCHPNLGEEARIALTLREVCALTTEAIANAFLIAPPTLAQRIVRAKAKNTAACIPYEVPNAAERPARLASVLRVVYLVFNEGHSAQNLELADEAICLALLLLHDARRAARTNPTGELVPLEEQDRLLWNRDAIVEGCSLAEQALSQRGFGSYALQAAIAALHGEAPSAAATDWPQIVGLYDALLRIEPSPVIALNRAVAVAVAMRDGGGGGDARWPRGRTDLGRAAITSVAGLPCGPGGSG